MKITLYCILLSFLLMSAGCAKDPELAKMETFYKKYDAHCRKHARSWAVEKDEQVRYDTCMNYFLNVDKNCPLDNSEPYMKKSSD